MEKYLDQFEQAIESYGYKDLKGVSREVKLLALYGYYNFYHADSSFLDDLFNSSIIYESGSQDHIDGIFMDSEADEETVELVSSYYVLPNADFISINDIVDYYQVMYKAAFEALHKLHTVRPKLLYFFQEDDDFKFGEGYKKLNINIITNYYPKSDVKKKYVNKVNKIKIADGVTCKVTFGQEVEQSVLEIESPKEYVDHSFLILDQPNNYLKFGPEKSLIVNISAKSLKKLYEQYHNQGLFAQNLRYYVKAAKTDSKIITSIQNKPDNFWYYNNGIIIICDKYQINNNVIMIDNFSIINGGQTTKLVGDTDFEEDFYIQCKIVKNKYSDDKEKAVFISEVAEATNTQKPIKDKDIVANRVEQRDLKAKMSKVGVFVQIKRGAVISKKIYPEPWQNTTNEELGQLLYSFVYQYPGSARNNKASITGNQEKYDLIFKKDYESTFLRDLCHFKAFYKKWLKVAKDNNYYDDGYMQGLLKNGMFFFAGALGVICKLYFNKYHKNQLKTMVSTGEKFNILSQYDISHQIFKDNIQTFSNDFYDLLTFIYKKYIKEGYIDAKDDDPAIIYSNFMKTDKSYKKYIMKNIIKNFDSDDVIKLNKVLFTINPSHEEKNKELLEEFYIENNNSSLSYDELNADEKELYDKLKTYRTVTFKSKKIKAYEVYRDNDIILFVKKRPLSLIELSDINCLTAKQLDEYGSDIIDIIKGTFNRFKLY